MKRHCLCGNALYHYRGRWWCLADLGRAVGVRPNTLRARIETAGMDVATACEKPLRSQTTPPRLSSERVS